MDTPKRSELAKNAVKRTIGEWAYSGHGERHIILNEPFEKSVVLLVEMLDRQVKQFEEFFLSLDDSDLQIAAGLKITNVASTFEDELEERLRFLSSRLNPLDKYHHMAIGAYPHERANYQMWANNDSFSEEELVWLSIGLEPTAELLTAYRDYKIGKKGLIQYLGLEADRRLNIIQRSQTLETFSYNRAVGDKALAWITSIELGTPKGFLEMLAKSAHRLKGGIAVFDAEASTDLDQMDGRERTAMAKLIAAMAIDCYGFDPKARRSEIPNEIRDITERLGLPLSTNTIRKYLRQGSEMLPDDWEPE